MKTSLLRISKIEIGIYLLVSTYNFMCILHIVTSKCVVSTQFGRTVCRFLHVTYYSLLFFINRSLAVLRGVLRAVSKMFCYSFEVSNNTIVDRHPMSF